MSAHTPGPWQVRDQVFICSTVNGKRIAIASTDSLNGPYVQLDEANATLIAAAPELLKVLKEILGTLPAWSPKAQAVIAKAEGRT